MQWQLKSCEVPFHAGQIEALLASLVLLEVQNVAVVAKNEVGDGGVQTFLVGTLDEKYGGVFHDALRKSSFIVRSNGGSRPRR
jgi:hypothetical protein